jgi:hypothetical protein
MISNEVDEFFRDFEIKEDQNFFDFHKIIQQEVDFDSAQIASFFITNERWDKIEEISLFEMSDPDNGVPNAEKMDVIKLKDYFSEKGQRLLYEFDFFSERAFFLKIVDVYDEDSDKIYPACVERRGNPPNQIEIDDSYESLDGIEDIDELEDFLPDE